MRPGQFNKNRNRNRNRGRHNGGNNTGGGNPANRVYDSNGPDVKVRGTAQTIAEKYMQLGRDAQASGDNVMAESYYQHSEHYYRLWLANQPAGQPIQFTRRGNEEEFEDEGVSEAADTEDDASADVPAADVAAQTGSEDTGEGAASGDEPGQAPPRAFRNRENRDGDNQQPREGGRERFRSRWGRRDRNGNEGPRDGNYRQREGGDYAERPAEREAETAPVADSGNWEAPSFLTRPVPAVPADTMDGPPGEAVSERRPRGRRSRVEPSDSSSEEVAE
jgi:hypothetical protein